MKLFRQYPAIRTFIFFLSVFIIFLAFYTLYHPPVLSTPDDWFYISYTREALPMMGKNNPTRVLPEISMSVISTISSQLIGPICGDFAMSIAIGTAIILALLITIYAYSFYALIRRGLEITETSAICITAFFLLFHFLAFRTTKIDNQYLFGAFCITNYYYYTIPILINASIVMYCIRTKILGRLSLLSPWKQGIFLLAIYLGMVSNLYANILLVTYFFLYLCRDFYLKKYDWKQSLLENKFIVSVLLFFLVILFFESQGGNATDLMGQKQNFLVDIKHTLGFYFRLLWNTNTWFKFTSLGVFITTFVVYYKTREKQRNEYKLPNVAFFILSFVIVNTFSILISAKSRPYYVAESDKMIMEFFWLLCGISVCMAFSIKRCPKLTIILPLLFLLLFCGTNTKSKTFEDVLWFNESKQVNSALLHIAEEANIQNKDTLTIYVPKMNDTKHNWPYPLYFGKAFSDAFYLHRLSKRYLTIDIEPIEGLTYITSSLDTCFQVKNDSLYETQEKIVSTKQ